MLEENEETKTEKTEYKSKESIVDRTINDSLIARGAMRELIENNRAINRDILLGFSNKDFELLEEYTLLSDGILKAAKLLTEINQSTPKIMKDVEKLQGQKKEINLDDFVD